MQLTETEDKIATLVTLGYSEKIVADMLCVSPKTVNNHKYNIFRKNNLNNVADLVREYILSKEDPKKYFSALLCLVVQLFAVFTLSTQNINRKPRMVNKPRISRFEQTTTNLC